MMKSNRPIISSNLKLLLHIFTFHDVTHYYTFDDLGFDDMNRHPQDIGSGFHCL